MRNPLSAQQLADLHTVLDGALASMPSPVEVAVASGSDDPEVVAAVLIYAECATAMASAVEAIARKNLAAQVAAMRSAA